MRNLNVEVNMWFWILICIFIQVSDTQIYYSTGNTRYCYNDPDFCVLCGCFETGRTEHTLRCGENEVVRMEYKNHQIKSYSHNHDNDTCVMIRDGKNFCNSGIGNLNDKTLYKDRVEVYGNCILRNTCTITVKSVEGKTVKLVRYPYVCESNLQDISIQFTERLSNPVFYFNGLNSISKVMDCDCSVYKSSGNLQVEIFYLHGDNICNKFDILPNTQLKNCTDGDVQLYTATENIQSSFLKIEIRNMTVSGDEVVFFKVYAYRPRARIQRSKLQSVTCNQFPYIGDDLKVTCTGCNTESTPTPSSSNTYSTSTESTTTNLNSGHGSSDQKMIEADFISKDKHEEKVNKTYAIFGGILAGVIIINIVAIGIYYFIRKRTQPDKSSDVPNQSSDTEYVHPDFHLSDETENPQYQAINF